MKTQPGINEANLARLQALFASPDVGRVLVADGDHMDWDVPDLKEVLGVRAVSRLPNGIVLIEA